MQQHRAYLGWKSCGCLCPGPYSRSEVLRGRRSPFIEIDQKAGEEENHSSCPRASGPSSLKNSSFCQGTGAA